MMGADPHGGEEVQIGDDAEFARATQSVLLDVLSLIVIVVQRMLHDCVEN